jgi:hypothetical protein
MTTVAEFLKSKYATKVLKPPRKCVALEAAMIPMEDGWCSLPKRLREHKQVIALQCDTFVGICFQDMWKQEDSRFAKGNKGGRWNWAAINLVTGKGWMVYSSLSPGSGHSAHFDLSEEGIQREALSAEAHRRQREGERGLKAGTHCLVHGFGYYGCGYEPYICTLDEAHERAASSPRHYKMWRDDHDGQWNLEQYLYELPEDECYKPPDAGAGPSVAGGAGGSAVAR